MTLSRYGALVLVGTLATVGCKGEMDSTGTAAPAPRFDEITAEQWARLADARIFFAHQSVGGNVLEGVTDILRERPDIRLNIVEIKDSLPADVPGLYHANVGRNGEPSTKLAEFSQIVDADTAADIALLKYCYADFRHGTDARQLFAEYEQRVSELRAKNPDVKIVHRTVPLVSDAGTLRHLAAVVRKKPPAREVNLIRHEFNELMRAAYQGKEPFFDLARLEATDAQGNAVTVRFKGQTIPVLNTAWTYDGGHLNETARRRIAEAFLAQLVSIYEAS